MYVTLSLLRKHLAYYELPPLETYRHFKVRSYDDVTFYMPI